VWRWEVCQLDISEIIQVEEMIDKAHNAVTQYLQNADGRPLAIRFLIEGASPIHNQLHSHSERWINEIRAAATDAGLGNIWVEKINLKTQTFHAKTSQDKGPLGELKAFLHNLPQDEDRLQALSAEFRSLRNALPIEARQNDRDGNSDPTSPETIRYLLTSVEELLMRKLLA